VIALVVLAALQTPIDEGTFVVRQDTLEIARETFHMTSGRLSTGGAGWVLASTIRYDRMRPVVVFSPLLEVGTDTLPLTLQFDVADPREPVRILGQLGRNRFTVRVLSRASERAREYPSAGRTVILDDSVFALYQIVAWFAGPAPVTLSAILPRSARREVLTVQELGLAPTTLNRDPATLRHVTVTGGAGQVVELWLAADGRLLRVEVPSQRLVVERAPSP